MTFAPVNKVLITGNDDGTIRLWNPEGGSPMTCEGHDNTVSALDVGILNKQEYLYSASFDGSVAMWDINRRASKSSLVVSHMSLGDYEVQCIRYVDHKQLVLAGTSEGVIHLYDPLRSMEVRRFIGHQDSVTCLALDENYLVSGAEDREVRVWNLINGQFLKSHTKHRRSVEDLFVVPESGVVVSCATDGNIICWDYTTEEEILCPKIKRDKITEEFICMAYKPPTVQDPEQVAAGNAPPPEPAQVVVGTESGKVLLFALPDEVSMGKGPEMDAEAESILSGLGAGGSDAGVQEAGGLTYDSSESS